MTTNNLGIAKLNRCKPIDGYIIDDTVGDITVGGKIVADFCEVTKDWFYTTGCDENEDTIMPEVVFTGREAEILAHFSTQQGS